jgi:hypothetical protein
LIVRASHDHSTEDRIFHALSPPNYSLFLKVDNKIRMERLVANGRFGS